MLEGGSGPRGQIEYNERERGVNERQEGKWKEKINKRQKQAAEIQKLHKEKEKIITGFVKNTEVE